MGARRTARRPTFATETVELNDAPRTTEAGGLDTERTTRSAVGARFCAVAAAEPTRSPTEATPKHTSRQRCPSGRGLKRPHLVIPVPSTPRGRRGPSLAYFTSADDSLSKSQIQTAVAELPVSPRPSRRPRCPGQARRAPAGPPSLA